MRKTADRKIKTENEKGIIVFVGSDKKNYRLSLLEKEFCDKFLEFRGNGTEAAFETYDCKNRKVAAVIASRELRKANIIAYINTKLEEYGFNDDNVKKQHLFILNQFDDLHAKNKAVDMFYKLKGDYAPEKVEVSDYDKMTNAELLLKEKELAKKLMHRIKK